MLFTVNVFFFFFFGIWKELLIKYLYDKYYDDLLWLPVKLFSITHTWWNLKCKNDVILTSFFHFAYLKKIHFYDYNLPDNSTTLP